MKSRIKYHKDSDTLYIHLDEAEIAHSELDDDDDAGVYFDSDSQGHIIGIEILSASKMLREIKPEWEE